MIKKQCVSKLHAVFLTVIGLGMINMNVRAFVGSTRDLAIIAEFGVEENIGITLSTPVEELSSSAAEPAGIGAATSLLLNMLFQEVPILVPRPLWENIVRHKALFDDFTKLDKTQLKAKYGKYPRFKTMQAIHDFREQARYLSELYKHGMQHINTTNTLDECKDAWAQDPLFKATAAPASLQQNHYGTWLELSAYLMCSVIPANRYDIRVIQSPNKKAAEFYLFLPHQYLERVEQEVLQNPVQYMECETGLSATERGLGLKIQQFARVSNPFELNQKSPLIDDFPEQLLPVLRSLFVLKKEVPSDAQHRWCLYIMGHGVFSQEAKDLMRKKHCDLTHLYEELNEAKSENDRTSVNNKIRSCNLLITDLRHGNKVIGLPIDAFIHLLKFLDQDIKTSLLFYSSCSAGGQQWLDSFEERGKPLQLSYPIMADTLSEAPSLNGAPVLRLQCLQGHKSFCSLDNLINWKKRSLAIDAIYDFPAFFAMARCPKPHPTLISHMIHCLCPASPQRQTDDTSVSRWLGNWFKRSSHIIDQQVNTQKRLERAEVNNITSIRLPGECSFKVVDSKDSFLSLTSPGPRTIDSHKIDLILLSTDNYQDITITKTQDPTPFPFMVSFIPGKASHVITTLKAPAFSLLEILDNFFCCEKIGTPKLINIKNLSCLDDLNATEPKLTTLTNVYIYLSVPFGSHDDQKRNGVILDHNGKHLNISWPYLEPIPEHPNFKPLSAADYKQLTDHLKDVFVNANTFKDFSLENNGLITLDEITDFFLEED